MNKILARGGVAAILLTLASQGAAHADAPVLDPSLQGQLERWLGAGPLYLENIYTRQAGDDSLDFHAAADGRGSNFTLLRIADDAGDSWVVGGYNPRSWSSRWLARRRARLAAHRLPVQLYRPGRVPPGLVRPCPAQPGLAPDL